MPFDYLWRGAPRRTWLWPPCQCVGAQQDQAQQEQRLKQTAEAEKRTEYDLQLQRAGLTGLLRDWTFDTYQDRPKFPDAANVRSRVRLFAQSIESVSPQQHLKPWLILYGDYGLGKSHLAAAVIRQLVDRNYTGCYFRAWTSYLKRLQASWDRKAREEKGESETQILAELTRGRVVVIDDLDKVNATEWTRSSLYLVLNKRYTDNAPTILTFNHALGDRALLDYVGEAVMDRIMQHAFDLIEFRGESFRIQSED